MFLLLLVKQTLELTQTLLISLALISNLVRFDQESFDEADIH